METFRHEDAHLSVSSDSALNSTNSHNSFSVPIDQMSSLAQSSPAGKHLLFVNLTTNLLRNGHTVRFVVKGGSMYPTIRDGEAIIVRPTSTAQTRHRDIMLYERAGNIIAHRVICMIGNDQFPLFDRASLSTSLGFSSMRHRKIPGWFILGGDAFDICDRPVSVDQVLGKVVFLERQGRKIGLDSLGNRLMHSMVASLIRYRNHISKTGILRFLKRTD